MARKSNSRKSSRKTHKRSKRSSTRHSKTVKYLQDEMHDLKPELVNPFKEDYLQLYPDNKYIDMASDFNPLSPGFKGSIFDYTSSNVPEVQQLLDLNLQSRNILNTARNVKLNVKDEFPNPLLIGKQAGGAGLQIFNGLVSPSQTHSTYQYTSINRVNPNTPQYLLDRIRTPEQMMYLADVNSEEDKNTLMAQNHFIYTNEYGFDPQKKNLLTKKNY